LYGAPCRHALFSSGSIFSLAGCALAPSMPVIISKVKKILLIANVVVIVIPPAKVQKKFRNPKRIAE
jgi:hypothetical protein